MSGSIDNTNSSVWCATVLAWWSLSTTIATAGPQLPNAAEQEKFKQLAAQTVLHVETSLRKIETGGPAADPKVHRAQINLPAAALQKEWRYPALADAVMHSYGACPAALGYLQNYANEATRPPKYHLGEYASQTLRFLKEDLRECRKLRTKVPDFYFARTS